MPCSGRVQARVPHELVGFGLAWGRITDGMQLSLGNVWVTLVCALPELSGRDDQRPVLTTSSWLTVSFCADSFVKV